MLCQEKSVIRAKSPVKKQLVSRWVTVNNCLVRKWVSEEIK